MRTRGLALLALLAVAASCGRPRVPERIILIVIDTLRRDALSCYGSATPTPNLDALAAAGTRFTNASSSFHQTTMSMAALFTGRTPSIEQEPGGAALPWTGRTWCGLARLARSRDACVPGGVPTLAEALGAAGYSTVGIVANPLLYRRAGYDRGFETWIELRGNPNRITPRPPTDGRQGRSRSAWYGAQQHTGVQVNDEVRAWIARRETDRFFLYVHYMDAHDSRTLDRPYAAGVALADAAFGELRRMLADAGLLDDAVVVVTADHGEALDEPHPLPSGPSHYGEPSFEPVLRVPLIVWPAVAWDPARFVRTDDTFRLVRELAGLDAGGAAELGPEELFLTEVGYWTYRDGRWKTILARDDGRRAHLFDLEADPAERHDVAAAHPERVTDHRRRIDALARTLAAPASRDASLTAADRARMRALGYVD